jgi:UDP-N-acetylmuramoyl-L-alanyl-D-glutamate--2,6-diaminopimelate ligase
MAKLACNFYNNPSQALNLIGVTGTNGKTSITFLLGQILEAYGKKIGVIGTIENRIGERVLKSERTTPEAIDLQKLLAQMVEENVTDTLMEVSSHALALNRVSGSQFKIGIFTNLTQDHLDFHHTMENYASAKALLFQQCAVGIVNNDSPYKNHIIDGHTCRLITYGIETPSDYQATDIRITAQGVSYTLNYADTTYAIQVAIPGKFTVYNTLSVIAAARELGVPMEIIMETLAHAKGVPGRIQSIASPKGYSVIVDYAHTPDGLENVLETIKQFATGKITTVFGCGGDRDNTKRPLMGEVASRYSDYVVITSDNPRSENPYVILDQVEVGVKKHETPYVKIEDRKQAIYFALQQAKKDDVVLIAGKGHENYQILNDRIIHFDDLEIVKDFLEEEQQ